MASSVGSQIILSLFDRLTDENPRVTKEGPLNEWDKLAAFKQSVAGDLTNLLNTRISQTDIPEEFEQLRQSVAAYGVHDYFRSPADRDEIRKSVERAVRIFEPRLTRVQVKITASGPLDLHFQIVGQLKADMGSEPVLFDAEMPTPTRHFKVSENR
ncbi:MAG: type VI secretion system baseplate subunit TssE [Acidobacteriota bacterium]